MLDAYARKKEVISSISTGSKKVSATEATINEENDKKRDRDEVDLFALNKELHTEVKHLGVLISNGVVLKDVALARSKGDPDSPLWNEYELNVADIAEQKLVVKQTKKRINEFHNKKKHAIECNRYVSKPPSRLFETPRSSFSSTTINDGGNSRDDDNESGNKE